MEEATKGWLIEFRLPEGTCWAGEYQDGKLVSLGIAPTMKTAKRFDSAEIAGRFAANFYGRLREHAFIIREDEDS